MMYNLFVRGGSWEFGKLLCQVRRRNLYNYTDIDITVSFRIVKLVQNDNRNSRR